MPSALTRSTRRPVLIATSPASAHSVAGGTDNGARRRAGLTEWRRLRVPARLGLPAARHRGTRDLADHASHIGSTMVTRRYGNREALEALGIERRTGVSHRGGRSGGPTLDTGERCRCRHHVWTAGMQASGLNRPVRWSATNSGRAAVGPMPAGPGVLTFSPQGNAARLLIDASVPRWMSCSMPARMGRFAGHNVVCDLVGQPMLPFQIDWYVTVARPGTRGAPSIPTAGTAGRGR